MFESSSSDFHCHDCGAAISLEQHRRKSPRCDSCEFNDVVQRLRAQLNAWNRAAGDRPA